MSTIRRAIYLNDIEPAPLSMRIPMGMETWVDLQYYNQNGSPYASDVAAQLQLTSRSFNQTTTYAVPSTDAVNGRARAVIPAGDITDLNGYRLRLVGTVDQQAALIAMGLVTPIQSAGLTTVVQDVIDTINLNLMYNVDAMVTVSVWHDSGKSNPFELDQTVITSDILNMQGGSVLASFGIVESDNTATLTMPAATVNKLPASCWWRLVASGGAGSQTLAEGSVTITGVPTP